MQQWSESISNCTSNYSLHFCPGQHSTAIRLSGPCAPVLFIYRHRGETDSPWGYTLKVIRLPTFAYVYQTIFSNPVSSVQPTDDSSWALHHCTKPFPVIFTQFLITANYPLEQPFLSLFNRGICAYFTTLPSNFTWIFYVLVIRHCLQCIDLQLFLPLHSRKRTPHFSCNSVLLDQSQKQLLQFRYGSLAVLSRFHLSLTPPNYRYFSNI